MKLRIFALALVFALLLTGCGLKNLPVLGNNQAVATVGSHELSLAEFNYYYVDAVTQTRNEFEELAANYAQYGLTYDEALDMITGGLDLSLPLTELTYNVETGETWADHFAQEALSNAQRDYALYDAALAANFQLPEEDRATLDALPDQLREYAKMTGYINETEFLRNAYGYGKQAAVGTYVKYVERGMMADAYYEHYVASLAYSDADYRSHEARQPENYNSYSYAYYRIDGDTQFNEQLAEELISAESYEAFASKCDELFGEPCISSYDVLHTAAKKEFRDWMAEADDDWAAVIPSKDEYGTTDGYYAVYLIEKSENTEPTASVRHLLIQVEDPSQKSSAYKEAQELLDHWRSGDATEESFAQMVTQHTDDTASAETGGLYEQIRPTSSYIEPFLNWCVDSSRKPGDTDIVETEYGYHIMYFVEHSRLSCRDQMIDEELRLADGQQWLEGLCASYTGQITNPDAIDLDIVSLQY